MSTAFTAGEKNRQARLGRLRDVVRQELVTRQLACELPPRPVQSIDLGYGQGTQAPRLARDLAAEPAEVRAKVRLERGPIEDYAERAGPQRFGTVLAARQEGTWNCGRGC